MYTPSNGSKEIVHFLGTKAQHYVTDENRKRLAEFDEMIKAVQREQKIIDAKSWEAARKIVLNS
jgi:hypothetical protein